MHSGLDSVYSFFSNYKQVLVIALVVILVFTAKFWMIGFIVFYRKFLSPLLPPMCRFRPTCSAYALEAVQKYGPFKGAWLATIRIFKCGPWHPGGDDPVP